MLSCLLLLIISDCEILSDYDDSRGDTMRLARAKFPNCDQLENREREITTDDRNFTIRLVNSIIKTQWDFIQPKNRCNI